MPVPRRTPKLRNDNVDDNTWAVMLDELNSAEVAGWEGFALMWPESAVSPNLIDHWRDHGAEIVDNWILDRPGSRPRCWWRFDAPAEPRRRWSNFTGGRTQLECRGYSSWRVT